ncbi:MAG TPA: GGDEF domain-containing protein [Epsilonproteobacteria bacterium]|nr:GGDEF domain-containing protein [Campylobacterota bacterium]
MVHLGIGTFAHSFSEVDNVINLNFYILSHVIMVLLIGVLFREKEDAISHLKSMAHYDYLTGLPNRHLLREKIHHTVYLAHETHCENAICFIDLDGFKAINDTYGHHAGDQLLKEVVYKLRTFTYGDDELLRLGGDEFLIIFNQVGNIDAFKGKLDAILDAVSSIERVDSYKINISLSMGISWCPRHGTDVKPLMEAADNAMYEAKRRGKNQYVFADELIDEYTEKASA